MQEVYNVEVSKYIGDKVEVTYSMGLNRNEYLVEVRYEVTKNFSLNASTLNGSVDEKNNSRIGAEYRIRF